jgi:hypothetical protein
METSVERGSRKTYLPLFSEAKCADVGQLVEQLIRNSRECFCAGFRDVAQSVFQTDP